MYLLELQKHDKVLLKSLELRYEVWTRNKRKIDLDNVIFTQKFLQDIMVEEGYIVEDNCTVLTKNTIRYGGVDANAEYSYAMVTIKGKI